MIESFFSEFTIHHDAMPFKRYQDLSRSSIYRHIAKGKQQKLNSHSNEEVNVSFQQEQTISEGHAGPEGMKYMLPPTSPWKVHARRS